MFDAHTHLQDTRLDGCREAVFLAAGAAGVTGACTCGTSPGDWPAVTRLAADRTQPLALHPAFGVHPWFVEDLPRDWLETLDATLAAHPEAAVGEIGIDGLHRELDRVRQREVFQAQLELAVRHRRAVVLHGARAWGGLAELLAPCATQLPGILVHAFSASAPLLQSFLAFGAFISFGGALCNPHARHVHAAALATPLDRLLIETDAPDLLPLNGIPAGAPTEDRGLNQPANLLLVARALAQLKGVEVEVIASVTDRNARKALLLGEA
jgi:TatD DNase family protein